MAVKVFSITIGSTSYTYMSDKTWQDSNGASLGSNLTGVTLGDTRNADGTYDVKVSKTALGSIGSDTTVTLTDENSFDRQTYRLALDTSTFSTNEIYGGRQNPSFSTTSDGSATQLTLTGINSGLLVSSDGKTISYGTAPTDGKAEITISGLNSSAVTANTVTVSGRTIIIEAGALGSTDTDVQITANATNAYSLALGTVATDKIAQYTAAGWGSVDAAATSAIYYSEGKSVGYYKSSDTLLQKATTASGNAELFRVDGLGNVSITSSELGEYFKVQTDQIDTQQNPSANVSLTTYGFDAISDTFSLTGGASTALKIIDNATIDNITYQFAVGAGVANANSVSNSVDGWDSGDGYVYHTAGNNEYVSLGSTNSNAVIYSEKTSKTFGLSGGLVQGKKDLAAGVSVTKKSDDLYIVRLGTGALSNLSKNVYAYGDYASIVSFSAATGVATLTPGTSLTAASTTFSGTVLTYKAAEAKAAGYDFQGNQVIYYSSGSGGETFSIAGLTSKDEASITPEVTGDSSKRYNIDLGTGTNLTITAGDTAINYNLTYSSVSSYVNGDKPGYSASAFTLEDDGYYYIGGHTAAYLESSTTNTSSLAANASVGYTYHDATDHASFALSGINNIFGSNSLTGAGTSTYFTVGRVTQSGGASYVINFTASGLAALNTAADNVSLQIVDKDGIASVGYVMANPLGISAIAAGFNGSVTGGAIDFHDAYLASGWSAATNNAKAAETGGYSSVFVFHKAETSGTAFSLSGLATLEGATFNYSVGSTNGEASITAVTANASLSIGTFNATLTSGEVNVSLNSAVFNYTGLSAYGTTITLTDNDVNDSLYYKLALGTGMSVYGAEGNVHPTEFTATKVGTFAGVSSYVYKSGGLSDGFGIYTTNTYTDTQKPYSGITTVTKYKGAEITTFGISGLAANITNAQVLDYVKIDSLETLNYYLTSKTESETTTYTLKKGNYQLTADIALTNVITVSKNVAIDLNGHTISNAGASVFSVATDGELIINDSAGTGSVLASKKENVNATAIANAGQLIVNSGTVEGTEYAINGTSGTVVINGGTIKGNGDTTIAITASSTANVIVTGGSVTGGKDGIAMTGSGKLDITGGTVTGTKGVGVNTGTTASTVNIIGGTVTGTIGLSAASGDTVNVIGGNVTATNANTGYAIVNAGTVNIGKATVGSLSIASGGAYSIFSDYAGNTYGTFTGSVSQYRVYSNDFEEKLFGIGFPTIKANAAVIVDESSKSITLNEAALTGISTASLTSAGVFTNGLKLGSDVTTFANRTDPTVTEGWMLSGVTKAGMSNVDGAIYRAANYLESWSIASDNKSVTRYGATGGASIYVSGLSLLSNDDGAKLTLTENSLGEFFNVSASGGTTTGSASVTGYTLTVNAGTSLFAALSEGESLTFAFKGANYAPGSLSVFNLEFASGNNSSIRTAFGNASVTTKNFSFSASILDGYTSDKFTYRAAGTSDYYNFSSSSTSIGADVTLKHVATNGLQTFSLSGLGSKFGSYFASAATVASLQSSVVYLYGTETGKGSYQIGQISLQSAAGDDSIGVVTLSQSAFIGGSTSQTITLTDLNMSDGVYYKLYLGTGDTSLNGITAITDGFSLTGASTGTYTFTAGGSKAGYTLDTIAGTAASGTIAGTSGTQIVYTPQVGGQQFTIAGLSTASVEASGLSLVYKGNNKVIFGSVDISSASTAGTAVFTLYSPSALGSLQGGGYSTFAFADTDSTDGVAYTLALSSAFNLSSAVPTVAASFNSLTTAGSYSYYAPYEGSYTSLISGTNNGDSVTYRYTEKVDVDYFTISGLNNSLTGASVTTADEVTTVTKGGASVFSVVKDTKGGLSILIYEGALSTGRKDITVDMGSGSLGSLSFYGTLGQSGVADTSTFSGFSATAGGSFTYTAVAYNDYYSIGAVNSYDSITAKYYAGSGGQSFTFRGLSVADGLAVSDFTNAINVKSTSAATAAGGFSITRYDFEVGSVPFLRTIPQGASLAVKFNGTDSTSGGLSLTISSNIYTTVPTDARNTDAYVAANASLAPLNTAGAASFVYDTDSETFTYRAKLSYFDWFHITANSDKTEAYISHKPQDGGQKFSLSGIDSKFNGTDYTYNVVNNQYIRAFGGSGGSIDLAQVSVSGGSKAYVYLTKAAFGSGSTITLTDGYDGITSNSNNLVYSLSTASSLTGYLDEYTGKYGAAKFASLGSDTTGRTYNFTASGIDAGINIVSGIATSDSLKTTTATYTGASGAEEFSISGLSVGLTGLTITADKKHTLITKGSASVIDVTGISTGAINVMVYEGALSSVAGRKNISLTGGTDDISYSLSLASGLLLSSVGTPYVNGTSAATTIALTGGQTLWYATNYKDYYTLADNKLSATHYNESGGQSFTFTILNSASQATKVGTASIAGGISVLKADGTFNDGQYELNNFVFGISKAGLAGLSKTGNVLYVTAGESTFEKDGGNYSLSFVGKTSNSVYSADAIMTSAVGAAAGFTSVAAGAYNFEASVGNYAWYERDEETSRSITFHEKTGGESFSITGLNTTLGALTYDSSTGVITANNGNVTVGSISFVEYGSASRYGYVYLTKDAFGGTNNATIAVHDADEWGDDTYYSLIPYSGTDESVYLKTTGTGDDNALAKFETVGGGTYRYTAAIVGEGVSVGSSANGTTVLKYVAQTGGQSFTISGLADNLNASASKADETITNVVDNSTGAIIGQVSLAAATAGVNTPATFNLKNLAALGTLASGSTRLLQLTDSNDTDDVDYSFTLDEKTFNYQSLGGAGEPTTALGSVSVTEDASGNYNVQVGGIPAWSENGGENAYYYYAAKGASAVYAVAGLRSGLVSSGVALSSIFKADSVILSASAVRTSVATVQVLNNASVSIGVNSVDSLTVAGASMTSMAAAIRTSVGSYQAATYKPWYEGDLGGTSLKVYPSVGGDIFSFTGFQTGWIVKDGQISMSGGTADVDVTLDPTTGQISNYTFTVNDKGLLNATSLNSSIAAELVTTVSGSVSSYTLNLENAINVGTGGASGEPSLVYRSSAKNHMYTTTARNAHVESITAHSYTYHPSIGAQTFLINNLAGANLTLGTDLAVDEVWSGDSLSGVNVTLYSGALPAKDSGTGAITITSLTGGAYTGGTSVRFTLDDSTESVQGMAISAGFRGTTGDYIYKRAGTEQGYYLSTDASQVLYSASGVNGQSFALTGLATNLGALSVINNNIYAAGINATIGTFNNTQISITSASALAAKTVTLTDFVDTGRDEYEYKLSIAENLLTVDGTSSNEEVYFNITNDKLTYKAAVSAAHYSYSAATGTGSIKSQDIYTYESASKLGYDFYFDGAFNYSKYDDAKYSYPVTNGSILAATGGDTETLAVINSSDSSIAIYKAAFDTTSAVPLYLTYTDATAGAYTLTLGDMTSVTSREESFSESSTAGTYNYRAAGNTEGFEVINYNGLSAAGISYTGVSGGRQFDLSGLKAGMSLSISSDGVISDNGTEIGSYVTQGKNAYLFTLNDNAFAMSGATTVMLSNVGNNYNSSDSFKIGNITFELDSTLSTGTGYTSNGGSFATALSSAGGYSITYYEKAKAAYWQETSTEDSQGRLEAQGFIYTPARGASNLFYMSGFSSAVTGSDFAVTGLSTGSEFMSASGAYAVNVADSLLPTSANASIALKDMDTTDGYDFYFAAMAGQSQTVFVSGSHPASINAQFSGTVFNALSRESYVEIGSGSKSLTYIAAAGGESFSLTGLADGISLSLAGTSVYASINGASLGVVGTLEISGSTGKLTLTNAAVLGTVAAGGQKEITLTDSDMSDAINYSLVINAGNNFYFGGDSSRSDKVTESSVTSGTYTYQLGAVSTYTTKGINNSASGIYSYVYNQATSGTEFTFTGLASGVTNTSAFGLAGTSFTLQDAAKPATPTKDSTITFTTDSDNAHYVLNNPDERVKEAANFHGNDTSVYYKEDYTDAGYDSAQSGLTTTYTYAASVGGDTRFTVTGLSSTYNAASMSYSVSGSNVIATGISATIGTYDGTTFTLNATGLSGATGVSIGGNGNLALTGVNTVESDTPAQWQNDSTGGVSYVTASNNAYWQTDTADKAYTFVPKQGGTPVFGIHGLSTDAANLKEAGVTADSMTAGGYSVNIDKALVNTAYGSVVSVTGSNQLYFSGLGTTDAAGYESLQAGAFNGTTYSIPAFDDQMVANVAGKYNAYTYKQGSDTEYSFGISVTGGDTFNASNFTPSLIGGGDSVLFTADGGESAARLDKSTGTVYIYDGILGSNKGTVQLTNPVNVSIAAGSDLNTTPGGASNSGWGDYGTDYLLYLEGYSNEAYFSQTDAKTLTYVKEHGGDYFKINNAPASVTASVLSDNNSPISVTSADGANYVFTINDASLRDYAVGNGGLSMSIYKVGNYTKNAGLSLTVAFAVNSTLGNNEPVDVSASYNRTTTTGVYTAVGTESYYMSISNGVNTSAVASLSLVKANPGESFTIAGLTSRASLGSDSVSIITTGNKKLVGITFAGEQDTLTGRYSGNAGVLLTKDAFSVNSTITVADNNNTDAITYGLSYGDGTTYLASLGGYSAETFAETDGTYNYSASTREQGITISDTLATYSASAGYGNTFAITGLAEGLSVAGGKVSAGTTEVGAIAGTVFTLTSLSALSTAAQDLGATTTFTLTNTGTATYSLSVAGQLALSSAAKINETLTGASGVYTYAAAHSGAYVAAAGTNSYTFNAEEKHDTFELSGNGLAAGLSLGSLSISGKSVTLLDTATLASASAGYTIEFNGDKDGDGNYYTIIAPPERETVDAQFSDNGTVLAYNDKYTVAGWEGDSGSVATFEYFDRQGGDSLFTVTGLSASFMGTSAVYVVDANGSLRAGTTNIGSFGASTLTLNATALAGASFVKLEGAGYSLAVTGVATSAATLTAAQFAAGTRTYYSAALSSFWSASGDNAYTFNAAAESAAQFALSGVGTAFAGDHAITGVSVADSTVVTINNEALSGVNVTLTNLSTASYSLSLGSNVAQSAADISGWTQVDNTASYVLGAASAYYTKERDTLIAFHDSVAGASAIILDGVAAGASLAAPANGVVSLTASDFSASGITVISGSESYAFSLATGDYNSSFTGMSIADSVTNSGSNIAINVGAGNDFINLAGGASSTLTLGEGNDTISVGAGVSEFTVTDFSADDVIVGSFSSIVAISGGIKAGDVVIKGITEVAGTTNTWSPSGANIAYVSSSTSGATLTGGKITLVDTAGGTSTLFTIFNVNSTLGVSLDSMTVTLGQSALDTKSAGTTVSLSGKGYTLALSGVAQSANVIAEAGFSGAIYSASTISEYWGASGTNAYYLNPSVEGAAQFSIAGATALANNIVSGTTVNIGEANLAGTSVTLTNLSSAGYSLALDSEVKGASYFNAGFGKVSNNSASYLSKGNTAGYSQASTTQIDYIGANPQSTLFTLTGISNTTGIEPTAAKVVTVAEANVAQNASVIAVTGTTEYTLAVTGLNTIGTPSTSYTFGKVSNNSASYIATTTYKDYWTPTNERTYTFTAGGGTSSSTVFTIDGIATIENSAVSGTTVTLGEKNFAGKNISLNGAGYSLALDGDYEQSVTAGGFGSLVSGAATYYGEGKSDGYSLTSTTLVTYAKGQSGAELFTASNITSKDNVSYAASAITASNETSAKLTLTNLSSALTIDGFVEITGLNATNQTVAGTPTDAAASGSNLVVTTADGAITIDGAAAQTVYMAGESASYTAAFDRITDVTDESAKSVTLTAGFEKGYYGLHYSYANGVTAVDATKANTTALNLTGSKQSDDLTLTGASAATNTLTGGSGNDTLTGGGLNDVLKGNAGADVFVQSGGNDTISDYTADEDTIRLAGTLANTAADSVNVTLTTADGNAIVVTNGVGQVIKTVDSTGNEDYTLYLPTAPTNASVSGEDLIVTADKDYTFAGASAATVTVHTSEGGTYTAEKTRITDITDETAKAVTLTSGYTNTYYGLHQSYGKGVTAVDASNAGSATLNLTGSKQSDDLTLTGATNAANTLIGGSGNDTLTGGGQGDSLKGNAGNDLFVQSAGNDTITDYTEGEDAIQLLSTETSRETVSGSVLITTAEGTILVQNGAGKEISIIGGEDTVASGTPIDSNTDGTNLLVTLAGGTTTTFAGQADDTVTMAAGENSYSVTSDRITDFTDETAKAVTLTSGFDGTYYGLHQSYGKGVTAVDASKANGDSLTLTGYKSTVSLNLKGSDNVGSAVTGGKADDTITGGTQDDTLKGNAGNDLFVQSAGNDTIVDYTAGEDVISLQSAYSTGTVSGSDVILTTEDGNTIQLTGGKGQTITTSYLGSEETLMFGGDTVISDAPVDVTVSGDDLVVEFADGTSDTFTGVANDTITMSAGDHNYSVQADRITDYTDENAKAVTLASGYTNTYYGLHQSYGKGVTAVDASKANGDSLTLTGYKSTVSLNLRGSDNVGSAVTGGKADDTIAGGTLNDTLKGNAGNDLFVQSAGNDTIVDYTAGEDVISLQSAITDRAIDSANVTLTTAEGSVIIQNGVDVAITTMVDDTETTTMFLTTAPTNAKADGDYLVVTTAKGDFTVGGATDTVTMYSNDAKYTVAADRITDVTDTDARAVTLTSDFKNTYYGLHYSYATGVTAVNASKAGSTSLTLTGTKSTVAVALTGTDGVPNSIIGGHADDTLTGGSGNDTLKGNAGADRFVQSGGDDVIVDYAAEDTIQLASAASVSTSGNDVLYSNKTGSILVVGGSSLDITTVLGGNANFATTNDELWGVNGVKDTFLFDGGNDTVHNYEEQDEINLKGYSLSELVNGAPSVKDSNLVFAFDKQNSFTIVDAIDKTISFTDGTTYSRDKK